MTLRQRSVFFLEQDGGYDGKWTVNVEDNLPVYADDVVQGYATREEAEAVIDTLREGRTEIDVREVRVPCP